MNVIPAMTSSRFFSCTAWRFFCQETCMPRFASIYINLTFFYFDYLGKHFKGLLLDTACKRQSSIIQFSISRAVPRTSCLLRCYTVSEQHYFCQEFQHICFFNMNSAGELFRLRTWQFYCEWRFLSLIEKVLNETGRTSHTSIQRYSINSIQSNI